MFRVQEIKKKTKTNATHAHTQGFGWIENRLLKCPKKNLGNDTVELRLTLMPQWKKKATTHSTHFERDLIRLDACAG